MFERIVCASETRMVCRDENTFLHEFVTLILQFELK